MPRGGVLKTGPPRLHLPHAAPLLASHLPTCPQDQEPNRWWHLRPWLSYRNRKDSPSPPSRTHSSESSRADVSLQPQSRTRERTAHHPPILLTAAFVSRAQKRPQLFRGGGGCWATGFRAKHPRQNRRPVKLPRPDAYTEAGWGSGSWVSGRQLHRPATRVSFGGCWRWGKEDPRQLRDLLSPHT